MPDEASIADVFPGNSVVARFVVSMSMATNDVERALRDVLRAGENDAPDFSYRVRLSTGHLVEALDALDSYSQRHEVRKLLARVRPEAHRSLSVARGTRQKVGARALQHVRDNTFHYPSPNSNYSPTSDEQVGAVLDAMGDRRADMHVNYAERHVTLTFADEVALALSMGKHAPTREEIRAQFETTRDGALAFVAWAPELVLAYFDSTDVCLGTPEVIADADE